MLSVSTMLIPFLEHNDGIRVNMVASQIRQAISLREGEVPLIRTGLEDLFLDYTTYLYTAKDNGVVIFKGDMYTPYIAIKYDNDEIEIIDLSYKALEKTFDGTLYSDLKYGQRFEKGEVIARTSHIDQYGRLVLGKNLLTTFVTYDGWNFEDAIVVSDKGSQKMLAREWYEDEFIIPLDHALTSLEKNIFQPIRHNGSVVKKNDVLFKASKDRLTSIQDLINQDQIVLSPEGGKFFWEIFSNIKPNTKHFSDFIRWINEYYKILSAKEEAFKRAILRFKSETEMDKLLVPYLKSHKRGNWVYDDQKLEGTLIRYKIMKDTPLKVGSKISNRHGNKGIISKILNESNYIYTSKGEIIDAVVGPLSPIARMNVGQLFEMHLTRATENFVNNILKSSRTKKETLLKYIEELDMTPNKFYSKQTHKFLDSLNPKQFGSLLKDIYTNGLQIIQPPFHSINAEKLFDIMKETNTPFTERIIVNGKEVNAIVGKMYFYRLLHEPEKKVIARSVGKYSMRLNQPIGGKRRGGGHRLGEMETWALMAYEAYDFLTEYLNVKSDNTYERIKLLTHLVNNTQKYYTPTKFDTISRETFFTLLKSIGIEIDIDTSVNQKSK